MRLVFTLTTLLACSFALAGESNKLLEASAYSGTVSPPYQTGKTCTVYPDRVVEVISAGGLTSTVVRAVTMTGDLESVIKAAKKGKVTTTPGPIGGRTMAFRAFDGTDAAGIPLLSVGGIGMTNDAPEATTLTNMLKGLCNIGVPNYATHGLPGQIR